MTNPLSYDDIRKNPDILYKHSKTDNVILICNACEISSQEENALYSER